MSSTWDPEQYHRFRGERRQPFFDLLALVRPRPQMRVVDLGCGTGELTRVLHQHLAARETLGIDSSDTMLAKSQAFAGNGLSFEHGDLRAGRCDSHYDLVFSNAALHWVPDHEGLFHHLTTTLAPGGQLAVQVPANFDHPTHVVGAEVAGEEPFRTALAEHTHPSAVLTPDAYALLLAQLGYREQHVRLQVYLHSLASREEVVEWVKGTLLVGYQQRMPAELFARFLGRYRACLLPQLDDRRPYFYPFKRLLLWAMR